MKQHFLLDPEVAYLNHGSFGACPRPVFEAYQQYQRTLEREPVDYLQRHFQEKMHVARADLAGFVGCGADDLAFVRNTTYGMNVVARSLSLKKGDVILISDHEYGAVDRMWRVIAEEYGAELVRVPLALPTATAEEVVEVFRARMDASVKVLALPHIAAETAVLLPVTQLLALAKEAGVISVIDGAHAPGQVPLDLASLGANFYVGNCHKWLLSPKGAGFVYAAPHMADRVRSPIIGWGNISEGSTALLLENEWQGTSDISAFMAVSDAIGFLEKHDWFGKIVPECTRRLDEASEALLQITGQENLYGAAMDHPPQMASFRLPTGGFPRLHTDLYERYKIELPVFCNRHGEFFRVSVQAYNSPDDLERLCVALSDLL
ncbi:aminotransferase class V-fold PLP-dependent enzyme [Haloferula sp.]|uniref:aminotransferase class V-fold PLP-dependent enzyme n=1 Tax=Haloferula sp. TaxID=2497595 RepID=UPI0032A05713